MNTIVTVCDVESRRILGRTPWITSAALPSHGDTFIFGGEEFFVDHARWEAITLPGKPTITPAIGAEMLLGIPEPALNVTLVVRATKGKTSAVDLSTEAVRKAAIEGCIELVQASVEWSSEPSRFTDEERVVAVGMCKGVINSMRDLIRLYHKRVEVG